MVLSIRSKSSTIAIMTNSVFACIYIRWYIPFYCCCTNTADTKCWDHLATFIQLNFVSQSPSNAISFHSVSNLSSASAFSIFSGMKQHREAFFRVFHSSDSILHKVCAISTLVISWIGRSELDDNSIQCMTKMFRYLHRPKYPQSYA